MYERQDREAGKDSRAVDKIVNANYARAAAVALVMVVNHSRAVARAFTSNHSRAVAGGRG